jgi:hypothetical protein
MLCLSYVFFSKKYLRKRGWNRFFPGVGGGEVAQILYTHVSKYKNDNNKKQLNENGSPPMTFYN